MLGLGLKLGFGLGLVMIARYRAHCGHCGQVLFSRT